jgi:hypothetical protein
LSRYSVHLAAKVNIMNDCVEEIRQYFQRRPRLNVVLVKSSAPVPEKELVNGLDCEAINLQKLVAEGMLKPEEINGYTAIIGFITDIASKATRDIVLIYIDLLLSSLDKQKRQYFFQAVLQKTFQKSIILITSLFSEEVPDTTNQEFNYAKSVQWR